MEVRKCAFCKGSIPADKRADSKFCSNSCKANYWEQNKYKKKEDMKPPKEEVKPPVENPTPKVTGQPLEGIRGVVENKPKTDVIDVKQTSIPIEKGAEIKIETQAYKDAYAKMKKAESHFQFVKKGVEIAAKEIREYQEEMEYLRRAWPKERYIPDHIDGIALMEMLPEEYGYDDEEKKQKISAQLREVQSELKMASEMKNRMNTLLLSAQKEYEATLQKLKTIPQYEIKKSEIKLSNIVQFAKSIGQLDVKKRFYRNSCGKCE